MRDLRRRALESNKTVSRKARSRISSAASSRAGSAANSRTTSRNPSRAPSEEELSDEGTWETGSTEEILSNGGDYEEGEEPSHGFAAELETRMEQIIERKRSTIEGRIESLTVYTHILKVHYAKDLIEPKLNELVPAILKSVRSETDEKETSVALKALAVTIITANSDALYDMVSSTVKRSITHSESALVKTAAIHTLATAALYGGAGEGELEDIMSFFLEIVESDGLSVDAHDDANVVAAAIEEWGFLASYTDDLEDVTELAMEPFVEQLESSAPEVAIAAGENIALLYERAYSTDDEDSDVEHEDEAKPVKRYNVWHHEHQLLHTLEDLSTISGRGMSKHDRKSLHTNFKDILQSVQNPAFGPRYHNAVNEGNEAYGNRLWIKLSGNQEMLIDRWWKMHRLKALRRVLGGGFVHHMDWNEGVSDSIPVVQRRGKTSKSEKTKRRRRSPVELAG